MAYAYNSQLDAFTLYHKAQEESNQTSLLDGPALPALGHAVAGSTGAAISNLATYPLNLVITRLQAQRQLRNTDSLNEPKYKSIEDAFIKIYNEEGGLLAFYSGLLQDTAKTIADSFLFFLAYNYLRQARLRSRPASAKSLPVLDELAVGMAAGAFSKFFTTPIQNIVTRKQTAAMLSSPYSSSAPGDNNNNSTTAILNRIYAEKGLAGFWSGYSASLILTLNPSLTFLLHETFTRLLGSGSASGPRATFLLAAISKAIASTATYPFSLAKTRAQASSTAPLDRRSADTGDRDIKVELEPASDGRVNATPRSRRVLARTTVLATIAHIARTEGVGALYEGLGGEVVKGFMGHGITMLVKERVHGAIVALYYAMLRGLREVKGPEEVKDRAGEMVEEGRRAARRRWEEGRGVVGDVYGRGKEMVGSVGGRAGEVVERGREMVSSATERGRDMLGDVGDRGREMLGGASEKGREMASGVGERIADGAQNARAKGSEVYERGTDLAGQAREKVQNGFDQAKKLPQKDGDAILWPPKSGE